MPLAGKGMLITLMDADPAEEQDFNKWYDKEHIIERVSLPGFLEARRYVAIAAEPKYLNFYTAETLEMLRSPAYLAALQNPTDWTRRAMAKFRNFTRAVAHVAMSRGQGRGGAIAFGRIRPTGGDARSLRDFLCGELDAVLDQVISAHLLQSDPELSRLSFCLLGTATPADLIQDTKTSPFNIGKRIELADFTEGEAAVLADGLGPDGGRLLRRILWWTGGHPYLTC